MGKCRFTFIKSTNNCCLNNNNNEQSWSNNNKVSSAVSSLFGDIKRDVYKNRCSQVWYHYFWRVGPYTREREREKEKELERWWRGRIREGMKKKKRKRSTRNIRTMQKMREREKNKENGKMLKLKKIESKSLSCINVFVDVCAFIRVLWLFSFRPSFCWQLPCINASISPNIDDHIADTFKILMNQIWPA